MGCNPGPRSLDAVQWWMWVLVVVAAAVLLDRLALWAEARGWIYWRRTKRSTGGGGGGMFGELMNAFQPTRQVIIAEREWQKARVDQAESGDKGPDA